MKIITYITTLALVVPLVFGTTTALKTAGEINPPVHPEMIVEVAEINPPVVVIKGAPLLAGEINPPVFTTPLHA